MQKVSLLSGVFRICIGLTLMLGTILAGFWLRSPVIVLWLGLALTVSYAAGRAAAWKLAWKHGNRSALVLGFPLTYAVQTVLAGLLYFFGLGIAAALDRGDVAKSLSQYDFAHVAAIATLGVVSGIVLYLIEGGSPPSMFNMTSNNASQDDVSSAEPVALLDEAVTPESIFSGIHYSHADNSKPEADRLQANESSAGSDAKIAIAERRLQVILPEALRAIYRLQNGGHVREICIAASGNKAPDWDTVVMPFSGYSDLIPLESLEFLQSHIEHYADPETDAERFPPGCTRMLVLARWYEHTLFLDYNECDENDASEPGVAFVNFEDHAWHERILRWKNFAAFFAQLRFVDN